MMDEFGISHDERIMTRSFCELIDAKVEFGETFEGAHEHVMIDIGQIQWYQDQVVTEHEPMVIASTLWSGRDAVDQVWTL